MITIAFLSRKGGCGKTLLSHLTSYGLGSLNYPVVMIQTDVRTEMPPEDTLGRPYFVFGIPSDSDMAAEKFADIHDKVERMTGSVLVVDGGANRRAIDYAVLHVADLVVIPCGYGAEDVGVARADYLELKTLLQRIGRPHVPVAVMLNRWPGDTRRLKLVLDRPWVQKFLAETASYRFPDAVPELTSVMDVTFHDAPTASLNVRLQAEKLAKDIAKAAALPPPKPPKKRDDDTVEKSIAMAKAVAPPDPTPEAFSEMPQLAPAAE